ncbi:glycosyltransferase family 1 protein [Pigmentiphaga sp. H8]|uniref:glycosyltransferase family 4 protein n=1 Tax=Pigmentiphaga sp. H8 TaxID=2488560 RepID=UPI000F597521|nr:glycosyltransferase family 4 protein [Pigmentiphaga sp. H8]AZG07274.1 glycosyltransferase family 1 protein [Pigmentiphaga sp. H8]
MKRKILFVRSDLKLAGPARLMLSSAHSLRSRGIDVVFASSGGELISVLDQQGFKHVHIPELSIEHRSAFSTATVAFKLALLCSREKFSVIHTFNAHAGVAAYPAAKITRAKIFNTVLGNGKEFFLKHVPFELVAVSQSVKTKLISYGVDASKIRVVYNSTLDANFLLKAKTDFYKLTEQRDEIAPITFVSVAMFTGQKGHKEIVDAVRAYYELDQAPPIRVIFVGDGPKKNEISAYIASLGLESSFRLTGATSEVFRQLDAAHVFIHLPEMETFGIVLAEAAGRGLPTIAADVGGIPEVVDDQQTGYLVNRLDSQAVARKMRELAIDRDMRLKMGWKGATKSLACFTQEKMADDLIDLYGFLN